MNQPTPSVTITPVGDNYRHITIYADFNFQMMFWKWSQDGEGHIKNNVFIEKYFKNLCENDEWGRRMFLASVENVDGMVNILSTFGATIEYKEAYIENCNA